MKTVQAANLAVAFLLELCGLAALSDWGFQTGRGAPMVVALGLGVPLLAALIWGAFVAPKAAVPVATPVRLTLKLAFFSAATAGLLDARHPILAYAFALVVVVNAALLSLRISVIR